MNSTWDVIVSPVTYQPMYNLKINGNRSKILIPMELFEDKILDQNEFMMILLDTNVALTESEIIEAYIAAKDYFIKNHS